MKIAIPVDNKILDSNVCCSFGRAPYFLIYDSLTNSENYVTNLAINELNGAGIKASQMLVDLNIDIVISPRLGQNASDVLNLANIKIYKSIEESARKNIILFKENKLEILSDFNLKHQGTKK